MPSADSSPNSLWLRPVEVKATAPTPAEAAPVGATTAVPTADNPVVPEVPTTLGQTGLAESAVLGLVLKVLYTGTRTGRQLADEIKISYLVLEGIITPARLEQ